MDLAIDALNAAVGERYHIERELGAGGMATVYLARDVRHDRHVALKLLRPELAAIIGADRFLAEIRTTANLQHPHILPLHDSGEVDGRVYYVMPFVEGESLRDRLNREKQLPVAEAVRIAAEVASALDYAHRQGVIHRDIKPENILLHDGRATVADFGIALAASRTDGGKRMTETGLSLGTPTYMSPEQALGERDLDARSDLYALGAVLYEMLAGEPPYTGPTAQAILAKVMTAQPEAVTTYRRTVPPHVAEAVRVALEKLPADRYASAREFAAALAGVAAGTATGSAAHRTRRVNSSRASVAAGITLAALVLAGVAGIVGRRTGPGVAARAAAPLHFQIDPGPASAFDRPVLHSFSFTADGDAIVFAARSGDTARLHYRRLDQPEVVPLAGTEGAANPFVSPDGRWIGFWAGDALRRVPLTGGTAQTLHDLRAATVADPIAMMGANARVYGAAWLPSDTIVFGRFSGGLRAVPADGGSARPLTELSQGEFAHRLPRALPGGKAILFTVVRSVLGEGQVEALDLRTGKRQLLIRNATDARYDASGHILFARAGSVLAVRFDPSSLVLHGEPFRIVPDIMHAVEGNVPSDASGAAQFDIAPDGTLAFLRGGVLSMPEGSRLAWVGRGGRVDTLNTEPTYYMGPRLSPDGRRIAVTARLPNANFGLRLIDLERGVSTVLARNVAFPLWAPDGSYLLARASSDQDDQKILKILLDGSEPRPLVESQYPVWPSDISADGRWFAFVESNPETGQDIWIMDLEAVIPAGPVLRTAANEMYPAISPDGRWLAYVTDESGSREVHVRQFDGTGLPEQVSRGGGSSPAWARDGRAIHYIGGDGSILTTAVQTAGGLRIGRTDLFAATEIGGTIPVGSLEIAPDGRMLVSLRTGTAASAVPAEPAWLPLQVIVNARALLDR